MSTFGQGGGRKGALIHSDDVEVDEWHEARSASAFALRTAFLD